MHPISFTSHYFLGSKYC